METKPKSKLNQVGNMVADNPKIKVTKYNAEDYPDGLSPGEQNRLNNEAAAEKEKDERKAAQTIYNPKYPEEFTRKKP